MNPSHVEIIQPRERIDPSLGGTGYVGPKRPASLAEISAELDRARHEFKLPSAVFKVLRGSVSWRNHKANRRLFIEGHRIPCRLIGGIREWWFVSIQTQ